MHLEYHCSNAFRAEPILRAIALLRELSDHLASLVAVLGKVIGSRPTHVDFSAPLGLESVHYLCSREQELSTRHYAG